MQTTRAFSILSLSIALSGALSTFDLAQSKQLQPAQSLHRQLNRFEEVLQCIRANYVDKPDDSKLVEGAIRGMLSGLDPHSFYVNAEELRFLREEESGKFGGVGIEIAMEDGSLKVVASIAGSPAALAGILPGDLITAIDGSDIKGMAIEDAVQKLRGPDGGPVTVSISRGSDSFDVKLVRKQIHIDPVRYEVDSDVGYIRISSFNDETAAELKPAIHAIKTAAGPKLKGFVLDFRNNPGGLLEQSLLVANSFLDNGRIVSIKGRDKRDTHDFMARHGDLTHGARLVVLINGGSASASEIVAGALQDNHRAILVGTRSFGKGSVQTMIPLHDKGALMVTTGRYFTPSGRSIQARGIDPDVVVEEQASTAVKSQNHELFSEATLHGHLRNQQAAAQEEGGSSDYVNADQSNDTQLNYALELVRGVVSVPAVIR